MDFHPYPLNRNNTEPSYQSMVDSSMYYEKKKLGWNTPAEYMEFVHPFWTTFDSPNPFLHYMLGVFYIIFMFASLTGNGVVIWVFSSAKSLRTPSNMFVINLAVCDFVMMLKTPIFILNSFNEGPIWGKLGCDIFGVMGSYSGIGASCTNAIIAYDRYKTIAKPFEPKFSSTQTLLLIIGIYIYATPFSILPWLGIWGRFVPEGFLTTCTFDYMSETTETKIFVGTIFFCAFCIPASFIVCFYSRVYSHVKVHEQSMKEQAKKMNVSSLRSASAEDKEKSAEIRILKVCMGLFFLFVISWGPYAVIALSAAFGSRSFLTPLVSMIPALTCKTVACIDPWVYAINHPKYRLELQKKLPWFCIHEQEEETASQKTESASTVDKT